MPAEMMQLKQQLKAECQLGAERLARAERAERQVRDLALELARLKRRVETAEARAASFSRSAA